MSLLQQCVYKTMQIAEQNVTVAESAPQTDTRSVCVIDTTVDNISVGGYSI